MKDSGFNEAFNWGFTNYDNSRSAFITTFQVVTMEGWTDIMARVIDAWSTGPAIIAFTLLIILGGIIALNIVLAVISGSLDKIESDMEKENNKDTQLANTDAANITRERSQRESFLQKSRKVVRRSTFKAVQYILVSRDSAIRRHAKNIVQSRIYTRFILATIVFNTIVLSCDHYGISEPFQMALDTGNFITTIVFFIDMVLCNIVYGVGAYWNNSSTCFDGIIALASMLELVVAWVGSPGSGKSVMSVFRSLRLVRLFKMAKQWESLHSLLNTMAEAASDVRSFGILLALFVFIYGLIGMQLFSNRLHFDEVTGAHVDISDQKYNNSDVVPRSNFDDFFWAMTTVFQILSGEDWNVVMYDCWKATPAAPVFFLSLVVLGIFCALNLFLAILLRPFDGSDLILSNRIYPEGCSMEKEEEEPSFVRQKITDALHSLRDKLLLHTNKSLLEKYNFVRSKCKDFVADRRFDLCLTCVIVSSSITLAVDDPLRNPNSPMSTTLLVLNYIFTSVFLVEFGIKVFAYGFNYFQDRWNWVDFTAVVASVLELSDVQGGKTLRVVRAFRVLRPLKMINRFPEIKVVVDALLLSLPSVVDVGVVCALLFLVFSIFGVTFLKGTFYECRGDSLYPEELHLITYPKLVGEMSSAEVSWLDDGLANCDASTWGAGKIPTSRELCGCLNGEWVETIPQNFNNVLRGFALLFEISSTER